MSQLFNRLVTVDVGPGGASGFSISSDQNGFRIAFDVEKTIHSDANQTTIQIFNLSAASRGNIQKGHVARLHAGYKVEGEIDLLFEGEVTRVEPGKRNGPDIVTTIECGDGSEGFQTQKVAKNFPAGTPVKTVILAVAKQFTEAITDPGKSDPVVFGNRPTTKKKKPSRLSVKNLTKNGGDLAILADSLKKQGFSTVLRRPLSVAGNAREVMDQLARMWRFDWSVQDGEIQVLAYGFGTVGQVLRVSQASGLVGIPEATDFGCKFTSLILPTLRPGSMVQISSEAVSGLFRAELVRFSGDSREGNFTADVEAASV